MPGTRRSKCALILAVCLLSTTAIAGDIPESKSTKVGLYLTAAEAAEMLSDQSVVFVDIRSRAEVAFLGLPRRVNIHMPYMVMPMIPEYDAEKREYSLEMNPDFPQEFKAYAEDNAIGAETRIVLICRSGTRSARAANLLAEMGFRNVYSVIDGYEGDKAEDGPYKGQRMVNGWKNAGLEWTYALAPEQLYPADR